jgi:flavodoxin
MSKVLIVCYSYTGTSRRLAQTLAAYQRWPLGEVTDRAPRAGFTGAWRCMLDSLLRRRPPIRYAGPDPSGFELVVLVAPIWAYQLAGPMRTFIATRTDLPRRFAMLCTMGSRGAPNAFAEAAHLLGRVPVLDAAFTAREIEDGSCADRLRAMGVSLQAAAAPGEPARPASWSPQAG